MRRNFAPAAGTTEREGWDKCLDLKPAARSRALKDVQRTADEPGGREFYKGWMDAWDTFGNAPWDEIKARWSGGTGSIKEAIVAKHVRAFAQQVVGADKNKYYAAYVSVRSTAPEREHGTGMPKPGTQRDDYFLIGHGDGDKFDELFADVRKRVLASNRGVPFGMRTVGGFMIETPIKEPPKKVADIGGREFVKKLRGKIQASI